MITLDTDENVNEELEAEFTKYVEEVQEKIYAKVKEAKEALNEACKIADENGVGFYSGISPLGQSYYVYPTGKFAELDSEVVNDITGTYSEYDAGWQHSAVC